MIHSNSGLLEIAVFVVWVEHGFRTWGYCFLLAFLTELTVFFFQLVEEFSIHVCVCYLLWEVFERVTVLLNDPVVERDLSHYYFGARLQNSIISFFNEVSR